MEKKTLYSDEEIRSQLIKIKGCLNSISGDTSSADIARMMHNIRIEQGTICEEKHGIRASFCHDYIEKILLQLQEKYYSAIGKETKQRIDLQILSMRLNKHVSKIAVSRNVCL